MKKRKDAPPPQPADAIPAPEPADPRLLPDYPVGACTPIEILPDGTVCERGYHADGVKWLKLPPKMPRPRPAPPRPKDVAELREWIERTQARWLEYANESSYGSCYRFWAQADLDSLLNGARALGLSPPPLPYPDVSDDPQPGLANIDVLLAWLATLEAPPETDAQPDGTAAAPAPVKPDETPPPPPAKLLASWGEILEALGLKKRDRQKVARLNATRDGPIIIGKKGQQPIVDHAKLLEWWNQLTIDYEVGANRSRDAKPTTAATHKHGRAGVAVPDIGGSERKRRADQKP